MNKYISVHPDICHGQPCLAGTRILVSTILELVAAGLTFREIEQMFPGIQPQAITAAMELEK